MPTFILTIFFSSNPVFSDRRPQEALVFPFLPFLRTDFDTLSGIVFVYIVALNSEEEEERNQGGKHPYFPDNGLAKLSQNALPSNSIANQRLLLDRRMSKGSK